MIYKGRLAMKSRRKSDESSIKITDVITLGDIDYQSDLLSYQHAVTLLYCIFISSQAGKIKIESNINQMGFKIIEIGVNVKSGQGFVVLIKPDKEIKAKRTYEIEQSKGSKQIINGHWNCTKPIELTDEELAQLRIWGLLTGSDKYTEVKSNFLKVNNMEKDTIDNISLQKLFDENKWWR